MKVKIYRYNSEEKKEPYFDEFIIPITKNDKYTLMDVLIHIRENNDSTIGFFSHSVCNHGICGRCVMKVNGKTVLACTYLVQEEELIVEPRTKKGNVIKDLLVE